MSVEINTIDDWGTLLSEAENGSNIAQLDVAMHYENGNNFVSINTTEAFKWTKIAYENGNKSAIVRYADYLSTGENCNKNLELVIQLYEKGIEFGFSEAAFNLGIEYRNRQDFESAFKYYQTANELSAGSYKFDIAKCYYYGIGIEKDKNKALEILKNINFPESNQYEVDEANYMLGLLYLDGEIVKKSLKNARRYLELANADQDHRSAKELLMIIGDSNDISR